MTNYGKSETLVGEEAKISVAVLDDHIFITLHFTATRWLAFTSQKALPWENTER